MADGRFRGVGEIVNNIDEVPEIATEAIKLPYNKCITVTQRFQTVFESGAIIFLAARSVAVDVALGHTGCNERVVLKVEHLRTVGFRNAHVADKRGERGAPQTVVFGVSRSASAFVGFHITNPITFSMLRKR
jgi:hypothetical protein